MLHQNYSVTTVTSVRAFLLLQDLAANKTGADHLFLFHRLIIMKNTVHTVILDIYSLLAALCSFRLLCRRRAILALLYPERFLAFEQSSLLFDGQSFSLSF